jgi:multidrug resistance efflux pump
LGVGLILCFASAAPAEDRKDAAPARPPSSFAGRVEAADQAGVFARVSGAIDKVNVNIGDRVKKGDVLIELSAPDLQEDADLAAAQAARARAEVETVAQAALAAKAQVGQAEAAVDSARASVRRAQAFFDQVKAEADRVRKLAESNSASAEDVEARVHQADAAKAQLDETHAQVKTGEAARDVAAALYAKAQAEVKAAEAGVEIAKLGVHRAQARLEYAKVLAPFDGLVTRRLVDAGAVVGPPKPGETAPLLTLVRDDVVHVAFDVDERSASQAMVGAPAKVHIAALPDGMFAGKVTRVAGIFNPDTGTMRVEIDVPNADGKLRPGMAVTVELKAEGTGK